MADIETIRALLQREIEENNLIEEHARSIYNVPTRTPVTIQQRENARKAVARARALQVSEPVRGRSFSMPYFEALIDNGDEIVGLKHRN